MPTTLESKRFPSLVVVDNIIFIIIICFLLLCLIIIIIIILLVVRPTQHDLLQQVLQSRRWQSFGEEIGQVPG